MKSLASATFWLGVLWMCGCIYQIGILFLRDSRSKRLTFRLGGSFVKLTDFISLPCHLLGDCWAVLQCTIFKLQFLCKVWIRLLTKELVGSHLSFLLRFSAIWLEGHVQNAWAQDFCYCQSAVDLHGENGRTVTGAGLKPCPTQND